MISVEKPGSPAEMLEHFGVKGQKWGVRKAVVKVAGTPGAQREHRKKIAKRVAIGIGVAAVVVGTAYVAYRLNKSGKLPISSLRSGGKEEGKVFKNLDEAIAAKRKAQGATATMSALKTHGDEFLPDPKLLAEERETIRIMSKQADWSKDWNAIYRETHGLAPGERHPTELIKWS